MTDAQVRGAFDRLVREVLSDLLACTTQYPELATYIQEWMGQLQGTTLACANVSQVNWGAYHALNHQTMLEYLPASEWPQFADLEPNSSAGRPVIVWSPAAFSGLLQQPPTAFARDTLIHEILHSITADNRADHNEVERIRFDSTASCADNIAVDRVNMIAMLCSGYPAFGVSNVAPRRERQRTVVELLHDRINHCGLNRGCTEVFAPTLNTALIDTPDRMRQGDLSLAQAESLCQRINSDGACMQMRMRYDRTFYEQGAAPAFSSYARVEPHLSRIEPRLRERLALVFPRFHDVIPAALIRDLPVARSAFERYGQDPCFRRIFSARPGGDLLVSPSILHICFNPLDERMCPSLSEWTSPLDASDPVQYFSSPRNRASFPFAQMRVVVDSALQSLPECHGETPRQTYDRMGAISQMMESIETVFSRSESSPLFQAAARRAAGRDEDAIVPLRDYGVDSNVGLLLGSELAREYADTLRRFHPRSDRFECNSIVPFEMMGEVRRGLAPALGCAQSN